MREAGGMPEVGCKRAGGGPWAAYRLVRSIPCLFGPSCGVGICNVPA